MMFLGASEWFFWLGVEAGLNATFVFEGDDVPIYSPNNETTRACKDAYKWGFALGLSLTEQEYKDMTTSPEAEEVPVETIEVKEKYIPVEVNESNFPIVGHC